jgi:selenide,water dikinase
MGKEIKELVLLGGGHTHVSVLKGFGVKPMSGVRITLIGRDALTPYSGMLPGYVAGHYTHVQCHIDLAPLSRFAKARFIHDEAVGLDLDKRLVYLAAHPPVAYDVLSIDIGSTPAVEQTPGAATHTTWVKPIAKFTSRWEALLAQISATPKPLRIGVVGGGAGGVELLLAIHYRLTFEYQSRHWDPSQLAFNLFQGGDKILPAHPKKVRQIFSQTLADRGIHVLVNTLIVRVAQDELFSEGQRFAMDEVFWVTQAGAADWLKETGLALDERGFIQVDDDLQSISHEGVFAVGDIAHMVNHPRPKAGVFAVRQGPPLTENLRCILNHRPTKPFKPQRTYLTLISTGNRYAVGSKAGLTVKGPWVWRWKDWLDRAFINEFSM